MSTFDGIVKEFPRIRIDYFRRNPDEKHAPLAYLLSHVHSDHLTGLETCKSPFIYCSSATRDVLLGLEKYQHRMNFAKQILEAPTKTYRHLKKILRPLPLETPATIELAPGNEIRLTLFDANHCVGAVMFLIEGNGHAVLYTGDIRSESWWVNGLTKHPLLVSYVARDGMSQARKPLKALDCIYVDTTFANKDDPYKRFPSKSDGLIELLDKVSRYPTGTLFHFKAWTFGYEEVWETLASHLGARVHVDAYKWKLYRALASGVEPKAHDAAKYTGFKNGNGYQEGCLTPDTGTTLHSCEKGTECAIWNKDFVQITPIITRHNGIEMAEVGAGGGQGDLGQHELDINDTQTLGMLFTFITSEVKDNAQQKAVIEMLNDFMKRGKSSIAFDDFDLGDDGGLEGGDGSDDDTNRPIEAIVPMLSKLAARSKSRSGVDGGAPANLARSALPKHITFPYSRHSSYSELCDLIDAFKPFDIHPCTVDSVNWNMDSSMSFLFGHIYAGGPAKVFSHDQYMISKMTTKRRSGMPASQPSVSESQSPRSSWDEQVQVRRRRRDSDDDSDKGSSHQDCSRGRSFLAREERLGRDEWHHAEDSSDNLARGVTGSFDGAAFAPAAEGRRLHIGNLAYAATVGDLIKFFEGFLVESTSIPTNPRTSRAVGHGFVDLSTRSEATRAIMELNGRKLLDRQVSVQFARMSPTSSRSPAPTCASTSDSRSAPSKRRIPHGARESPKRARNAVASRRESGPSPSLLLGAGGDLTNRDGLVSHHSDVAAGIIIRPVPSVEDTAGNEKRFEDGRSRHSGPAPRPSRNDDVSDCRGRLSPPSTYESRPTTSRAPPRQSSDDATDRLLMKYELSAAETSAKASRHHEAYEAALGLGGRQWSDIGLISSGGHQSKEEEL